MTKKQPAGSHANVRGSRNESTRQHNLSLLLSMAHHDPGISRADMTRLTGLNRSTVGALVTDLAEAGLVREVSALSGTVGRPSPRVTPDPSLAAIAVNPDVDAIAVALVGMGGAVLARTRVTVPSLPTPQQSIEIAVDAVRQLRAAHPEVTRIVGVGAAVPGLAQPAEGLITRSPHLDWHGVDYAGMLADAFSAPAFIDNDANVGLIAEAAFGAGREFSTYFYMNGSASGIGGALIAGGTVLRGADGYAGELGHTVVDSAGPLCHCGRRGCLETEVQFSRLKAAAAPTVLDFANIASALADVDAGPVAAEIDRQVEMLAGAISSHMSVFNPQAVILGGFLAALFERRGEVLRQRVADLAFTPLADRLVLASDSLGDDLMFVGAAELAFAPLLADPLAG
ncbi:ROK family transcriptional regulator [Demequina globuliformis]|uniref:ROK family transcriptional regulator n=1 Tax=Demequina globuliformis TaxID=676202 RepID=UPI0007820123|nr:ROK family transcriptional regulator [Demequina globuliformis]